MRNMKYALARRVVISIVSIGLSILVVACDDNRSRYTCANGTPTAGIPPIAHTINIESCARCNSGYYLVTENLQCEDIPGGGTENDPYRVDGYPILASMRDHLDAHYILTTSIDARPSWGEGSEGCISYNGVNVDNATCTGWTPVGSLDSPYTGILDGQGNTIRNLYINRAGIAGFIGHIGNAGDSRFASGVTNLGLTDVVVVSNATGDKFTGGLAVANDGTVWNSYVTGSIRGILTVGGLVAKNNGYILNSYANSSVNGEFEVGGLVGNNEGFITSSYATNSVSGIQHVGGLVGVNIGDIMTSYASAHVDAETRIEKGGLVGRDSPTEGDMIDEVIFGAVSDSYWDTEQSDQTSSAGDGATGLTTLQMQAVSGVYPDKLGSHDFLLTAQRYPRLCIYRADDTAECEEADLLAEE